jgi:hypothetical protein
MRVTTAFKHLVRLDGIRITGVAFGAHAVTVTVSLRRRRLDCPLCSFSTWARLRHPAIDVGLAAPRPRLLASGDPRRGAQAYLSL